MLRHSNARTITAVAILACGLLLGSSRVVAEDIDREPICYSKASAANAITRLEKRLQEGAAQLKHEPRFGYLRSLLKELAIPESSQMLVFSKTSLQRNRISPRTPRAIYFNDDVYVGFCQQGTVLELSAADPKLGTVFYTLDQNPERPRITRQRDECMICHASSLTQGYPGNLVRSVYADDSGYPLLALGTHRIDQTSPLEERWGGWYVAGKSGKQSHLGNLIVHDEKAATPPNNKEGVNVTDLAKRFRSASYLSPTSDIVALLVLEHQAEMHNRITRANFQTRLALHEEAALNKAFGRPDGQHSESTQSRIKYAGDQLVQYMLMCSEPRFKDKIAGVSNFARDFQQQGIRDARGRSLRDLDLEHRLFRYPCSYLVYTEAFDALPAEVKNPIWQRLWDILTGKDQSAEFAHLSTDDRTAILEILGATKQGLPAYWISGK